MMNSTGTYHGIAHPRKEEMPPMDPVDAQVEADVASGVRPERAEIVPHSTPRQIDVAAFSRGTWAHDHWFDDEGYWTNAGKFMCRLYVLQSRDLTLPGDLKVRFMYDSRGYFYAQVYEPDSVDNVTGEAMTWYGRKWLLSEHMTDAEIVQTVFKAVMTAVEHEVREQFLYKGQSVFDPHYDLEKLVELRREKALSLRKEKA